jgi:hypothetical protein
MKLPSCIVASFCCTEAQVRAETHFVWCLRSRSGVSGTMRTFEHDARSFSALVDHRNHPASGGHQNVLVDELQFIMHQHRPYSVLFMFSQACTHPYAFMQTMQSFPMDESARP